MMGACGRRGAGRRTNRDGGLRAW